MQEEISVQEYEKAEAELRAIEERKGFYIHAAVYVLVNILLIIINLTSAREGIWFFYPLIGWGIGLALHFTFAIHFIQAENENWQAKVEFRARKLHLQATTTS